MTTSAGTIVAIANQKGGVGKTTTAINLATALTQAGNRVLLVDLDPQGNASTGLGVGHADRAAGTYALITEAVPASAMTHATFIPNLSLIPAETDLAGAEIELVGQTEREFRLRRALRNPETLGAVYDFILIDCPPSLGLLTINGLVAADSVLVPLQCEFFALEGLSQLLRTVDAVKSRLNPALDIEGIVLTMYDKRNNLSEAVSADARSFFGDKVYETVIPRNVRVSEAPSHGKPVILYDYRSPASQAYIKLAMEMLSRQRRRAGGRA